jgi:hypothetical protein
MTIYERMNFMNVMEGIKGLSGKELWFTPRCGVFNVHNVHKFTDLLAVVSPDCASHLFTQGVIVIPLPSYELMNVMNVVMR